jgi:hypothetical protein
VDARSAGCAAQFFYPLVRVQQRVFARDFGEHQRGNSDLGRAQEYLAPGCVVGVIAQRVR